MDNDIQNLKLEELQRSIDRNAQLIATLSDKLDAALRNNDLHSCDQRLHTQVLHTVLVLLTLHLLPLFLELLWRRVFQGRKSFHPSADNPLCGDPSNSPAVPQNDSKSLPELDGRSKSTSDSDEESIMSSEPEAEPTWSVEYHPEAKRVLELHLVNVVTYRDPVSCVKVSPDGHRVAVGLRDGTTYLNGLRTGSNICTFVDRYEKAGYHVGVTCLQFSPDGQLLATLILDGKIIIWDIAQKRMRAMFKDPTVPINGIAFSPNGRSLVSGSDDATVRIWNLRDGSSQVMPVTRRALWFNSVAFRPDGRYIAGGNFDNSLWIWDSRTHRLVARWCGHRAGVRCIEFTPDGKGLMSGSKDGTIKYWDMSSIGIGSEPQNFPEIRGFSGHTDPVCSIAFFPGKQWIGTGSDDRTVRVWDIESGVCYLTLHGHTNSVHGTFSPTHNLLISASWDRRVAFWKYKVL